MSFFRATQNQILIFFYSLLTFLKTAWHALNNSRVKLPHFSPSELWKAPLGSHLNLDRWNIFPLRCFRKKKCLFICNASTGSEVAHIWINSFFLMFLNILKTLNNCIRNKLNIYFKSTSERECLKVPGEHEAEIKSHLPPKKINKINKSPNFSCNYGDPFVRSASLIPYLSVCHHAGHLLPLHPIAVQRHLLKLDVHMRVSGVTCQKHSGSKPVLFSNWDTICTSSVVSVTSVKADSLHFPLCCCLSVVKWPQLVAVAYRLTPFDRVACSLPSLTRISVYLSNQCFVYYAYGEKLWEKNPGQSDSVVIIIYSF